MRFDIRLVVLAVWCAVLCAPSVAMAQEGDPGAIVNDVFGSWGVWPVFAANCVALAIYFWRLVKPHVWNSVHPKLRRLIPPTVSALTTVIPLALSGADWPEIGQAFVAAWASVLMTQDVILGLAGKPSNNESRALEAEARAIIEESR